LAFVRWRLTADPSGQPLAQITGRGHAGERLAFDLQAFVDAKVQPAGYGGDDRAGGLERMTGDARGKVEGG
jgi:hypothetical protein